MVIALVGPEWPVEVAVLELVPQTVEPVEGVLEVEPAVAVLEVVGAASEEG